MIEVSQLSKFYGPRPAIENLNFKVEKGEVLGFLGPNGAGKTTTMKILTSFTPATHGSVKIAGFDVFENPLDVKRIVGYLPETPPVYMEMTVNDYVRFAAELKDVKNSDLKKNISNALEKTGLTKVRNRVIGNLSKGYRQRVGLAQAIVHNPPVLILDEPTVGLDPVQIIEIRELIKGLAGDHTIILSTHILPEVTATCQRILIIHRGRIVAEDSISKITQEAGSLYLTVKEITTTGLDALKSIAHVKNVGQAGHQIIIEMNSGSPDIREEVISKAVQSGLKVLEFTTQKASLEQVFLKYISQDQDQPDPRDQAGEQG